MGSIIDKYGTSNPNYKSTSPSKGAAPSRNMTIVEKYGTSNPYYVAPNTSTTNADDIAPVGTTTKKFTMSNLGNNGLGGTFLGGWKQPEAKEKKTPAAAEIAAQQKEAGEAAKRLSYLETLDLSAQQKKIDALTAESKKGAKLNVHAFGGYDPKNLTETEMALAEAQEDYNLAKSLQYSAKGKEALEALDSETYAHIDNMALWKVSASKFRKKTGKDNVSEDLQALYDAGLTLADIEQLVDYRKRQINADVYDERVAKMQELASRDDLLGISDMGAVAASILSVPLNLGSGAGYLDLLNQQAYIKGAGYDRPLDYKTGAMSLYGQASAARETVSQGIMDNAKTELGGQVGSFLYQTGMSMADSAVVAGLGVLGLGASGTLLLGGSAATAAAVDAKNRGGSDSQALWSGALAGAAETVFEKVSIDNLLTGKYTKNFVGSEFKKLLADLGVQGAVEGSEELFTEFANHITDKAIMGGSSRYHESIRKYMAEGMTEAEAKAKAGADFAVECATSFVGGVISGGIMGSVANAARPTVGSYTTQITENDQKVIDKLVENSIAEAEKDGKKLTDKEKAKLRDKVMESVERGEVSFDTIAEVLDKEGYDAFKKLAAEEQKAIEELAELYEGDEFQQEATKFLENAESRSARAELDKKVFGMVKDGKLAESYMERGRRSQAYTADLTKYDEKQRATIQNAINSGVLNDTRRTHEFVDLIAKIAADKGIVFDFTNNEKLKGSMFAVEGKTVNGYVTKDGVTLNIDSAKALNSVVGHEITHVLEGTELYGDLQKILFEYAKSRKASNSKFDNEYSERLYNARQLYKDVDGYQGVKGFEEIKKEVVADLVGDYLFTDSDFVNNLVKHKNLFQKLWSEIKYLHSVAKAGSKEEKQLLEVKRAFEKAYQGTKRQDNRIATDEGSVWDDIVGTKKATEDGGVKWSLEQFEDGRKFVDVKLDQKRFDGLSPDEQQKEARRVILEKFAGKVIGVNNRVFVNGKSVDEYAYPAKFLRDDDVKSAKMRASTELDNLVEAGENFRTLPDGEYGHVHEDATGGFVYFDTLFKIGDNYYEGVVNIKVNKRGWLLKDVTKIKNVTEDITSSYGKNPKSGFLSDTSNEILTEKESEVKWSLSRNAELMQNAEDYNNSHLSIDLDSARQQRQEIYDFMTRNADRLKLPEDIEGNTAIKNSSYDITEENTTVCIRSMAADALCDAVAEELGRPLTVQDTLRISQDLMNYTDEPECVYCYVATDRRAYREFLGSYYKQMQSAIEAIQSGKNSEEVYQAFLDGRKDTKNMRNRFAMWQSIANGGKMISAKDLASEKMMQNAMRDPALAAQVKDARAYAQSASWAKKRMGYQAYNGHILGWSQRRINDLNKHYGLRFYSFSDFSPAFVLENMQQITDASVRGLKGLAYTKVLDFAEIFAPTDININISVFGYDQNGTVAQDGMMGADWKGAQDLRNKYENVGITFVATNDAQIDWALDQDWIDVVIPYHLVRTGQAVAKHFGYTNYTAESGDTKGANWQKGGKKTIYPSEHNNDKQTYLAALAEANLEPRFARWVNHPNYMKLVNETRRAANDTPHMRAEFNVDAAKISLERMMKQGGYFVPIGGDYANMQDIATEIADDIRRGTPYSLSEQGEQFAPIGDYNVYGEDIALAPVAERTAPVAENTMVEDIAPVAETAAPVVDTENYSSAQDRAEKAVARIDRMLEYDKAELENEYNEKREALKDRNAYISNKASELYDEIRNLKKGVRASDLLGELLDSGYDWSSIRSALTNIKYTPDKIVNVNSAAEARAREILNEDYENSVYNLDEDYAAQVKQLEDDAAKKRKSTTVAHQRKKKQREYYDQMAELAGDTSTWVDKKLGISYRTNTLKRNLRDIVRDGKGKQDIAKADAIYNELQGKYNTHEAMLNRESTEIKKPYANMKITKAEDEYIQMLGELRHNPDTTLTEEIVKDFYEKHKKSIDTDKVDEAISMARKTYDELLIRVNNVLREQGMKEIPYRKGYFPHFTEEKQSFLAKLFNWKVRNNDIPTDIAGLTENFNPNRSWQSFNKQRKSDITDYSFTRGMDTYVQGALDWIYHIEDIQKRRAFENYIRYVHSEKGVQEKIDAIKRSDEYDADEAQEQIDLVLNEAGNPLNNFVTDLRAGTNTLANKKSSLDRTVEELTSRKFYSVMTNVSNRVSANMVAGSVSSALTNFIPITQSWGEVSPISSLRAMGDTLRSYYRDDGMVDKSDFLTNRLRKADNLYKTGWDKVSDKVGFMMEAVDSFASQTVWRSKYLENISNGMSENEAITNADQFAESVMAGRSRGNMPTIFNSKNPLVKTLTAFQLEVANQYGYMFKDMPQEMKDEATGKLVKGYVTMFLGAYAYNALYSSLTGREAALDPIGIIEDLLRDLGLFDEDEEEEPSEAAWNLVENVVQEVPFVGGLLGGGRIPIASALPYDGDLERLKTGVDKLIEGDTSEVTSEWLKPLYYMALPMGGGQIKKSVQGLQMFSDKHPVAGSYTSSGNLRFPVEDTIGNRVKAAIFGQYASKEAREYFDSGFAPLKEKQIKEFAAVDMPISEYWEYRKGLAKQETVDEKLAYIDSLDLPISKKNILANNAVKRKNPIDMADYK